MTLGAFIQRDWLTARSYRAPFVLEGFGAIFSLALFYYLGQLIDRPAPGGTPLREGYFAFAILGVAVLWIGNAGMLSFSQQLRQEQTTGTLEALVATPSRSTTLVIGTAAFNLLRATFSALVMLLLGVAIFGLRFHSGLFSLFVASIAFLCSLILFAALGVAVAAFTVVFKQTTGLLQMITPAIALLSGVYFPVQVLPRWLQLIAEASPFTWTLDILRAALLRNETDLRHLVALLPAAAFILPAGLFLFERALQKARRDGSLGQY